MSWLYSQALVAEYSEATCSDGAQSALSSGTPTPRAFLPPDRMTDFSRPSRFGMTFGPLTDDLGGELLTWFLAASRARTSALPERVTDSAASDPACGQRWRGSLARYDHDTRSWRTAQHSLLGGSDEYSETWPRWGTTVAGELYLLPTLVRPTGASESGSWPTPIANDAQKRGNFDPLRSWGLAGAVKLWPTPNASDNRDRGNMSDPAVQRRIAMGKQIGLSMAVKDGPQAGSLNPTWVEWLMGWPLGWTDLQPLATDKYQVQQPLRGAA